MNYKKTAAILFVVMLLMVGGVWYYQLRISPPDPEDAHVVQHVLDPEEKLQVTELDLRAFIYPLDDDPEHVEEEPERLPDDRMITSRFIQDLASLIFGHYQPGVFPGDKGRLTLSFKELNMHYATDLTGLRYEEQEVLKAREEIFGHLLQPEVIDLVIRRYGPDLIEELIHLAGSNPRELPAAQGTEKRLLTRHETAEMLDLLAQRLDQLSFVFQRTIQDERVLQWVEDYLHTVEELNTVYFEYWQLEESQNARRDELSVRIKQLIMARENIRSKIVEQVSDAQIREEGHDVVYEAQWIYRRIEKGGFSRESILALAGAGRDLAGIARDRVQEMTGNDVQTTD